MREVVPFALLALACGAALRQPGARASGPLPVRVASAESSGPAPIAVPSFDTLAAHASTYAPGMREVARKVSAGDKAEILPVAPRDTCVRVAFESSAPVVAKLLDAQDTVLTAIDKPATSGVLGAGGPVCVRKGETIRAAADAAPGEAPSVRWLAWGK